MFHLIYTIVPARGVGGTIAPVKVIGGGTRSDACDVIQHTVTQYVVLYKYLCITLLELLLVLKITCNVFCD